VPFLNKRLRPVCQFQDLENCGVQEEKCRGTGRRSRKRIHKFKAVSSCTPTFFFLHPHKVAQRQNYPYIKCTFISFFVFRIMKSGKFLD